MKIARDKGRQIKEELDLAPHFKFAVNKKE